MTEYRDPSPASDTWGELNRLFGASFRVGRLLGVEIRVLWIAVILFPLITLVGYTGAPPLMVLTAIVAYPLLLGLVILTHEMGHVVAGWQYRIHTPLITLSPLGGLAHMGARAPGPRSDLVITLAGPAVHLLWLALFWPLSRAFNPFAATFLVASAMGVGGMTAAVRGAIVALCAVVLGRLVFGPAISSVLDAMARDQAASEAAKQEEGE